jgi:hypothetical protein
MRPNVITKARLEALARGDLYFSVEKPCSKGHVSQRYSCSGACIQCNKNNSKTESFRNSGKRYYQLNKEKRIAHSKQWKLKNPTAKRGYDLKKYNLTYDQYLQMLKTQNNCCAICKKEFENNKHTHVDHCHDTGKVRGLLCNKCNLGIGYLRSSPEIAESAANYLRKANVS